MITARELIIKLLNTPLDNQIKVVSGCGLINPDEIEVDGDTTSLWGGTE